MSHSCLIEGAINTYKYFWLSSCFGSVLNLEGSLHKIEPTFHNSVAYLTDLVAPLYHGTGKLYTMGLVVLR